MKKFRHLLKAVLLSCTLGAGFATGVSTAATLVGDFYPFDVPGSVSTTAKHISDGGVIVGTYADANFQSHGFIRDTRGEITTFDPDGSIKTEDLVINAAGDVAGTYLDKKHNRHGFVRRARHGDITTFDIPGSSDFVIAGISAEGIVSGTFYRQGDSWAFVRDQWSNLTRFQVVNDATTELVAMNAKGVAVGSFGDIVDGVYRRHGFVRTRNGQVTKFEIPNSERIFPLSINSAGTIAGYYVDKHSAAHGFVGDPKKGFTTFDISNDADTYPRVIDVEGAILGSYGAKGLGVDYINLDSHHGFLRDSDGVMTSFDVPEALYSVPTDMNSTGKITGQFVDKATETRRGFVFVPRLYPN